MTIEIAYVEFMAFLLATVRAVAWLLLVPPFGGRVIPVPAKLAVAVAIALPVASGATVAPPPDVAAIMGAVVLNIGVGLCLGFVAMTLFGVFQAAGDIVDVFTGFAIVNSYDPFSNAASTPFGKIYNLVATALLFATGGHLLLFRGFLASFRAVPLTGPRPGPLARLMTTDVASMFSAALQIGAPVLAALFVTEVALGLLSRAAPQANVFLLGLPVKILLAMFLTGFVLMTFPGALGNVVGTIGRSMVGVIRLFGG